MRVATFWKYGRQDCQKNTCLVADLRVHDIFTNIFQSLRLLLFMKVLRDTQRDYQFNKNMIDVYIRERTRIIKVWNNFLITVSTRKE